MKHQVTGFNNFCRVFQMPNEYPKGYCHGGGLPTMFIMVDWFYPVSDLPQWSISEKHYMELVEKGEIKVTKDHVKEIDSDELQKVLTDFLKQKIYVIPGSTYLVVCDFGMSFTFKQ